MPLINCDDVRYRLGANAIDFPDAMLNSIAFIPDAEAWLTVKLGYSPDTLTGTALTAARVAMICYVAKKALTSAPAPGVEGGPVSLTPAGQADKDRVIKALDKEIAEKLRVLGIKVSFASAVDTGNYNEVSSAW